MSGEKGLKKRGNKLQKQSRHPTERKGVGSTHSHPVISLPVKDRELLKHLNETKNKRFNIKEYSRNTNIPRGTIYDALKRLQNLDFISSELADKKITRKGQVYVESCNLGGVGNSRWECRNNANLSTHYQKFKLKISDKNRFNITRLKELGAKNIRQNKLHNLHQIIADFSDATIVVNPNQVIINLFETINNDVEESDISSLSRVINYAEQLQNIGLKTEGLMIEEGHWARVKSVLSDFLYEKVDERYFITLNNGTKFWIDHSDGKREDETDDKIVRQRIDNFLNQVSSRDFDFEDIDKIKNSLGFITKLESTRLMDEIEKTKLTRAKLERKNLNLNVGSNVIPNYVG